MTTVSLATYFVYH